MSKRFNPILVGLVVVAVAFLLGALLVSAETDPETGYEIVYADTETDFNTPCSSGYFLRGHCADIKVQRLDSAAGLDGPITLTSPASYNIYALSRIGYLSTGANCFLYNPVNNSTVKVIASSNLDIKWYKQSVGNVGPGQYKHRFYCEIYWGGGIFEDSVDVCVYNPAVGGCGVPAPGPVSQPAPTVDITANPMTITQGQLTTVSWTSTNTTSSDPTPCTGSRSGEYAASGSFPATSSSTTSYGMTCTGPGGSATDSVTVTVGAAPPPLTPIGYHDGANDAACETWGWARDADTPSTPVEVHVLC